VLAACAAAPATSAPVTATPAAATIPEITIGASEYAFESPDQVEAGLLLITYENKGTRLHNLVVGRLKEGKTLDDFKAAAANGGPAVVPLVDLFGGSTGAFAGERHQVILDLTEGSYVIFSFEHVGADPIDVARGMFRSLTVVARKSAVAAPEPVAQVSVVVRDNVSFEIPSEIRAGKQTWKITNEGAIFHPLAIWRLVPGRTLADLLQFIKTYTGTPPADKVGGVEQLSPGKRAWANLDLTPGDYVVLDPGAAPNRAKSTAFSIK
jgi:hypothetical protein